MAFVDPCGGVGDTSPSRSRTRRATTSCSMPSSSGTRRCLPRPRSPSSSGCSTPTASARYRRPLLRGARPRTLQDAGRHLQVSRWSRSDLFVELLPLLTCQRARLLDVRRLTRSFFRSNVALAPVGSDTITHPRDGHDDVANAVAGALVHCGPPRPAGLLGLGKASNRRSPHAPSSGQEILEPSWHKCPAGCGWEALVPFTADKCPRCNPGSPTGDRFSGVGRMQLLT